MPNVSYCVQENEVHYNPYKFFCKLTLNYGSVVELEGSGELTSTMTSPYVSTLVSAEIGELCTSIGNNAFASCLSLTSATIGNSVTSIGDYAFCKRTRLESVTIGNNVTSIGNYAFSGCTNLTSVTIPNSVTSIGNETFGDCI